MKRVIVPIDMGGVEHQCVLSPPKRPAADPERIAALIERYHERHGRIDEVFFVHGGLPNKDQLDACEDYSIRVSLSPYTLLHDHNIAALLQIQNLVCVELEGLTSDDKVLNACHRGYTRSDQERLMAIIKDLKPRLGYVIATGLPNSKADIKDELDWVVSHKPDFVRIYPAQAWVGSILADWGKLGRWIVDEAKTLCQVREWLTFCEEQHIDVIRVGQQAMHDIPCKVELGPRVDGLRMRVGTMRYFDRMAAVIASSVQERTVTLAVNPKELAMAKGIENDNIRRLRAQLEFADIRLVVDERVRRGDVHLLRGTK